MAACEASMDSDATRASVIREHMMALRCDIVRLIGSASLRRRCLPQTGNGQSAHRPSGIEALLTGEEGHAPGRVWSIGGPAESQRGAARSQPPAATPPSGPAERREQRHAQRPPPSKWRKPHRRRDRRAHARRSRIERWSRQRDPPHKQRSPRARRKHPPDDHGDGRTSARAAAPARPAPGTQELHVCVRDCNSYHAPSPYVIM